MSQLVDLYNKSPDKRPVESRQIPGKETDFFDREHEFADGFSTGQKKLSPTEYTQRGLDQYNEERDEMTPPESYDQSIPLHRYTPETPYDPVGNPDNAAS